MKAPAIRITAVPRSGHPNSGLQAMEFAAKYGDEVWALPAPGKYLGNYPVRFFAFDNDRVRHLMPAGLLRRAFIFWSLFLMLFRPGRFYIIHNVLAAIPAWLLGRSYSIFIHGTDRRHLDSWWGRAVARGATNVFGVGFGERRSELTVTEVPNIFIPAAPVNEPAVEHDLLFVLRNAAVKNPCYPIELAEKLGLALGLTINVAGVAEDELPPNYRKRLLALQESGCRIHYFDRLPYEKVVELMHSSRTLMIPSFSEGIPKVLLEALSLGMNVAANEVLSFPAPLSDCVDWINLEDWEVIAKLIERERKGGRNEQHKRLAREYLLQSQIALSSVYDEIYNRNLGFVPSPDRLVAA